MRGDRTMKKLSRACAAGLQSLAISILAIAVIATSLAAYSFAQQADTPKAPAPKKQASAPATEKSAESATTPESAAEPKPVPREASGDKEKDKEEHYDMTEAAPAATHHQITVDGKLLKYTATAGRLPIKRGDGRIEAEIVLRRLHARWPGRRQAAAHVRLQRRAGVGFDLAAHGSAWSAQSGDATRWLHASGALPHGGQRLHAARQERPGSHRRHWHRLQPRGRFRTGQEVLGSEGRH